MGVRDNWMLRMYAANRRSARCAWRAAECVGVKSSNLWADRRGAGQRERECDSHARHHPGRAQLGLVLSPIVAASGNTPIGPSARPPPNDCLEMRMEHGLHAQWSDAALLAIPRPSTNVTGLPVSACPVGSPNTGGALSSELERGARLYRPPGQLSISQRVCRTAPDPGPSVEESPLEDRTPVTQPSAG